MAKTVEFLGKKQKTVEFLGSTQKQVEFLGSRGATGSWGDDWKQAEAFQNPFKRTWDITKEEFTSGIKDIGRTFQEQIKSNPQEETPIPYMGMRSPEQMLRGVKTVGGAMRTAWSPITGVTRAFFGEPAETYLEAHGAPPLVSKGAGLVAELTPQVLAPTGIFRESIVGALPTLRKIVGRIAYGPRIMIKTEQMAPETEAMLTRLTTGLKQYRLLRKEQDILYKATRSKRYAKMEDVTKQMEEGFITPTEMLNKKLAIQKGPLGKIDQKEIDEIAKIFQPSDLDNIILHIQVAPNLNNWEKMATQSIFRDAIEGKFIEYTKEGVVKIGDKTLPINSAIDLLQKTLPRQFVDALVENQSGLRRATHLGIEALNIFRANLSSGDLSFGFRQAVFAAPKNPVKFTKAMGSQFKYAFSERSFQNLMKKIKADPLTAQLENAGLTFTELGGMGAEERFIGESLAEKIPIWGRMIRGSSRAYTGGLNKFRYDIAKDFTKRHPEVFNEVTRKGKTGLESLSSFINSATGRGNLPEKWKGAINLLNALFFSPRLAMSRVNTMNPIWYAKLSPSVRKEAIKTGIAFYGSVASILTLLGISLKNHGYEVGTNITSADFGKIKKGNTRFDILGGYQQYFKLMGQLAHGKITSTTTGREYTLGEGYRPTTQIDIAQRFLESKANPVISFVLQMGRGKGFAGQEFDAPAEVINRLVPMVWQDMYDLYKEGGLKDVPWATPAVFGVGLQTYGRQIPTLEMGVQMGKYGPEITPKVSLMPMPGIGEDVANWMRGTKPTISPKETWEPFEGFLKMQQEKDWLTRDINKMMKEPFEKPLERMNKEMKK